MNLTLWSPCFYSLSIALRVYATVSGLCHAGGGTQGFEHAGQALYQLGPETHLSRCMLWSVGQSRAALGSSEKVELRIGEGN